LAQDTDHTDYSRGEREATSGSAPHQVPADALGRAFNTVQISRTEFDVLAIYLPNRWERGFWGPRGDSFGIVSG
jgi:hypothetical protein